MLEKVYQLPIYKKLGESHASLCTKTRIANIFIDSELKLNVVEYKNEACVINSITESNGKTTTITTNTLGIIITDIKNDQGVPLYYKAKLPEQLSSLAYNSLLLICTKLFGDNIKIVDNEYVYSNNNQNVIKYNDMFIINKAVLDLNLHSIQPYEKVKSIRKLKNTFKITINSVGLNIKLKSFNLYTPEQLANNSITFNQSINLFNLHTFYKNVKKEIVQKDLIESYLLDSYVLSDEVVIQDITPEHSTIEYETFFSNLSFTVLADTTYVYAGSALFDYYFVSPREKEDFSPIIKITKEVILKETSINTALSNSNYLPDFSKLHINSEKTDYKHTPFGKYNFIYNLKDFVIKRQKYLETDNYIIYQTTNKKEWDFVEISEDLFLDNNLSNLITELNSYFQELDNSQQYLTSFKYETIDKEEF